MLWYGGGGGGGYMGRNIGGGCESGECYRGGDSRGGCKSTEVVVIGVIGVGTVEVYVEVVVWCLGLKAWRQWRCLWNWWRVGGGGYRGWVSRGGCESDGVLVVRVLGVRTIEVVVELVVWWPWGFSWWGH